MSGRKEGRVNLSLAVPWSGRRCPVMSAALNPGSRRRSQRFLAEVPSRTHPHPFNHEFSRFGRRRTASGIHEPPSRDGSPTAARTADDKNGTALNHCPSLPDACLPRIDANSDGVVSREDSNVRSNGFRTWRRFRPVHVVGMNDAHVQPRAKRGGFL
jgi:hypothetical protein